MASDAKRRSGGEQSRGGLITFLREDHRYVFLGTSVFAALGLLLVQQPRSPLGPLGNLGLDKYVAIICLAWLAISAVALVVKLTHWDNYDSTFLKRPDVVRATRILSYVVWAAVAAIFVDRVIFALIAKWHEATTAAQNPQDFLGGAMYMVSRSGSMYLQGVATTIELAVFGTIIAFFLALMLVFLRIQEPNRSDNDFVKFLKVVGSGFATLYSSVIRGTPMMVQGLIIYSAGFAVFRAMGMSVSEVTRVWTYFIAGLVIISLNSTAYIMEALRGGIEAVDYGQTEAARSLGLTQWQAMINVVFPQGVRNAIPALSNEVVINIKDSSVLSVVGVFDLMFATTTVSGIYYRQMEVYIVAALIYLVLTYTATRLLTALSRRLEVSDPPTLPSSN